MEILLLFHAGHSFFFGFDAPITRVRTMGTHIFPFFCGRQTRSSPLILLRENEFEERVDLTIMMSQERNSIEFG
jgi:hypothetical protein